VLTNIPVIQDSAANISNFICNICGASQNATACQQCGASIRTRRIIHHLSRGLFGSAIPLGTFPVSPAVTGLGLNNSADYATHLYCLFDYANQKFHEAPPGRAHFIIAEHVLPHIPSPIATALAAWHDRLHPGGLLLLTAPFAEVSAEHYPSLHRYQVVTLTAADRVLLNRTADGTLQTFENLIFREGTDDLPELRVCACKDTLAALEAAGFTDVQAHDDDAPDTLITARRQP
jgi:hypothetical protein